MFVLYLFDAAHLVQCHTAKQNTPLEAELEEIPANS